MIENWKPVLGFEGLYDVSDLGRVKTLERKTLMPTGGIRISNERILKPSKIGAGYLSVVLCKNFEQKRYKVHRLVFEAFNGKTNLQIDHILEGNKLDNRLCNLQALSKRQNISKHRLSTNKTSQYTGVTLHKQTKKWSARIDIDGKQIYLGLFINEYDAHLAYQSKLSELLCQ